MLRKHCHVAGSDVMDFGKHVPGLGIGTLSFLTQIFYKVPGGIVLFLIKEWSEKKKFQPLSAKERFLFILSSLKIMDLGKSMSRIVLHQ
jgi:hypothetical protein